MVYRMCNIPLSDENFEIEKNRIYSIAKLNGYSSEAIDSIIRKHKRQIYMRNVTSLTSVEEKKRISMVYYGPLHTQISKCFKNVNVCVAAKSTTKIQQLVVSTKDNIQNIEKPGVYRATCPDCGVVYVGQTRREMKVRAKEHLKCVVNNMPSRSAIAEHTLSTDHQFTLDDFVLLEHQQNRNKLNVLESIHIQSNGNNLNRDGGPCTSPLFKVLKRI